MKSLILLPLLALPVFFSCADSPAEPTGDRSSESGKVLDGVDVLDSPDGYGNVATYCFGPWRIFVGQDDSAASSSIFVVADPTCETTP